MPKEADIAQNARRVVEQAIGEPLTPRKKNPAAVALGRLGGLKGGDARAAKLTSKQRKDSARKASAARWGKRKSGI